jgi:hypothetical protein
MIVGGCGRPVRIPLPISIMSTTMVTSTTTTTLPPPWGWRSDSMDVISSLFSRKTGEVFQRPSIEGSLDFSPKGDK